MSTIFNIHKGGKLNVKGADFRNLGGTNMAFVVHLNNWGDDLTFTADNAVLESTYTAIRVFNSGPYKSTVDISNGSTIKGASRAVWVQNYPSGYGGVFEITISEDANIIGVLRLGSENVDSFDDYNNK